MLIDGRQIAEEILAEVRAEIAGRAKPAPRLSAITCAPNFETQRYLEMKKKKAYSAGVILNVVELSATVTTAEAIATVLRLTEESTGVVVQLPFPAQVDREALLSAVPVMKDPDGFHYGSQVQACLPPVVGAIDEISKRYGVGWVGKRVVVLGEGRLVGQPTKVYALEHGAEVTVLNKENFDEEALGSADIIVSGIGKPHFIKSHMISAGVVVFDAGTSEDGGILVGDADPSVIDKASLLTPVPGGIGPITIAYLLRNLIRLASQ